jgi:hypothetical protein
MWRQVIDTHRGAHVVYALEQVVSTRVVDAGGIGGEAHGRNRVDRNKFGFQITPKKKEKKKSRSVLR